MKIFFSEHQNIYSTYTFSYGVYCTREPGDNLSDIYAKGFLPFTGDLGIKKDVFYLARSVRIDLEIFEDTSENRRVNRLAQPLNIEVKSLEKSDVDIKNPDFLFFCTNYAKDRFVGGRMDRARLKYIFNCNTLTHIFSFFSEEKIFGYAFTAIDKNMLHLWYSFFDVNFLKSHALGKWIMWRTIKWAKENGLDFVYLGTCYKTKALYKVRDFKGAEFFDGISWNKNSDLLKHLCKEDEEKTDPPFDNLKSINEKTKSFFNELYE
jgi:leucyl-tRNA---protein transferase